jgi:hypothetical protein
MATPRVFVSSTCIDFQEIRRQLRQFIKSHGFEPVMSEFNDVFYDFNTHVQDACKHEIERCNLFILIVGNKYGSLYHKETISKSYPDSITLQEFKKALEIQVPKHIFIDTFVKHDYDNYVRALEQNYTDYFEKNDVKENEIETATPILLLLAKNARYIHKRFYATCCKKNSCEHRTGSNVVN